MLVITDINTQKPGAVKLFSSVKELVFQGLALAEFNTKKYKTLNTSKQKRLLANIKIGRAFV